MTIEAEDRLGILSNRRRLKMAGSAHAYVRGNTVNFYEWLKSKGHKLPQGPPVWICGDCHLGNLGPVASADGRVRLAIRDFDQTVIGNPVHDLIRLGLSLATAIRGSDLPGVTTALVLEQMVKGYEEALISRKDKQSEFLPDPIKRVLRQAVRRRWRHLAEERIEDVEPVIPLGKRFWPLSDEEKAEIEKVFKTAEVRSLITSLKDRDKHDKVKIFDAAYWVKGCSSLGRLRFAVLAGVGKRKHRELCLVDIKEAVSAVAPRYKGSPIPKDYAERVAEGARTLSPFLGKRMLAWKFLHRSVVLRELLPQDLKLEMDQLTRDEAISSARFLASVVGRAHAAQMDRATKKRWRSELAKHRSKNLDAPSWLWTSVVELVATHEPAYLEHCREYAIENAKRLGVRAK